MQANRGSEPIHKTRRVLGVVVAGLIVAAGLQSLSPVALADDFAALESLQLQAGEARVLDDARMDATRGTGTLAPIQSGAIQTAVILWDEGTRPGRPPSTASGAAQPAASIKVVIK